MRKVKWDIHREGRPWTHEEFLVRINLIPEKTEVERGRIFWSDEDRLNVLGMLLENVGIDKAIRLGDPKVWKEAIKALK